MKYYIQILLLLNVLNLYCQEEYRFWHLTAADGLGNSSVLSISKDTLGFMWFGTEDGLYRYDANDFKTYKQIQNNTSTLANNYSWALFHDSENKLWIGNRGALNVYNQIMGSFARYYINDEHKFNKSDYFIYSITEDKNKQLWVGTTNGLFIFDKQQKTFKKFTHPLINKQIKLFRTVAEDNKGNIWIATDESNKGGLLKLSVDGQDTLFQHDTGNVNSLGNNNLSYLFVDQDNNIWIGHREGLDKYETRTKTFVHYSYNANQKNTISSNNVYCINQAKNGLIWVGTDQGISIINAKTNNIQQIKHNKDNTNSILSNSIHSIYFDEQGTAWIGSRNGGVDIYDVRINKFVSYHVTPGMKGSLTHNNIQKFAEDTYGNIWITTDGGGLNILNKKNNYFYDVDKTYPETSNNKKTIALLIDQKQNLWTGYWDGGITVHSLKNNNLKFIKKFDILDPTHSDSRKVLYLYQTKDGTIWVGTWYSGLYKYNPDNETFIHYPINDSLSELNQCVIHKIFEDNAGNLWIGTEDKGVFRLNQKTNQLKHFSYNEYDEHGIKSRTIYDIFQDSKNRLWVGTSGGGLHLYNYSNETFKAFNTSNGLPNNSICSILEDSKGFLWISYDLGISKLELIQKNEQLTFLSTNFNRYDGIEGIPFAKNASFCAADGQMFFGGPYGFNSFYPDSINYNKTVPKIAITQVLVNYNPIVPGNTEVPVNKNIELIDHIHLNYKQSVISIKFAALNFINPHKNKLKYTLSNFDNNWAEANNQNEVTYTNLHQGTYILKIRAANNDGVWTPNEKHFKIIVHPPFWRTKLFIVSMLILLIIFILSIYYYKVSSIKKEKQHLEKQVQLRTIEIKQQKDEIQVKNETLEYQKKELESATEELIVQTEELKASNEAIADHRDQLENAITELNERNTQLNNANQELDKYKLQLERLVRIRTRALQLAKDRAEESDKLKTSFLQNLSHEIRTPMNAIKGFTNLLIDNDLDSDQRILFTDIVKNSSNQLLSIVEDILTIATLETNQGKLKIEEVNVNSIFDELECVHKETLVQKNIALTISKDHSALNSILKTDKTKLIQILNNLLLNAIKFTNQGFIDVGYRIWDKKIEFYVKDTGIGIPNEMHTKIFKRFTQAEKSIQIKYGGSGLGLAISKSLVELLGGEIWLKSEPGVGSEFYFSIPL